MNIDEYQQNVIQNIKDNGNLTDLDIKVINAVADSELLENDKKSCISTIQELKTSKDEITKKELRTRLYDFMKRNSKILVQLGAIGAGAIATHYGLPQLDFFGT